MEEIRIRRRMHPALKAGLILIAVLAAVCIFLVWFRKNCRIHPETDVTVMIIGDDSRYTEDEIRAYVFDRWYENYLPLLKLYYRFRSIEPLTYTEKITISFEGDQILVKAYEKVPIGCLLVMNNYLYFDSEGMILDSEKENTEGLPVVEGIEYSSVTLGKVFETKRTELFPVVMNIVNQLNKYQVETETITFSEDDSVTIWCDGNRVSLGIRDSYDVPIGMLSGILKEIQGSNEKYRFDLSEVTDGTEKIVAKLLSEDSGTATPTETDESTGREEIETETTALE